MCVKKLQKIPSVVIAVQATMYASFVRNLSNIMGSIQINMIFVNHIYDLITTEKSELSVIQIIFWSILVINQSSIVTDLNVRLHPE